MPFRHLPPSTKFRDEDFAAIARETDVKLSRDDRKKINFEIAQYERRYNYAEKLHGDDDDQADLDAISKSIEATVERLNRLMKKNPTMVNSLLNPNSTDDLLKQLSYAASQFSSRLKNNGKGPVPHFHHLSRFLMALHKIYEKNKPPQNKDDIKRGQRRQKASPRRLSRFSKFAYSVLSKTQIRPQSEESLQADWEEVRAKLNKKEREGGVLKLERNKRSKNAPKITM